MSNYIWHPRSQMKDYEEYPAVHIKRGKGIYVYDDNDKSYLDAVSSWWVNLFGHSNDRINEAVVEQINTLEHVIFANFTHDKAEEFAEKIIKLSPDRLEKVFFADNGSSSVEIALKMAFHAQQFKGNKNKTKFVALEGAYHGETLGALSVCDLDDYSKIYKPLIKSTYKAKSPDCYRCDLKRSNCNAECFSSMAEIIEENHESIAAVIIEPMIQGAAGMNMYSPIYLKKLREYCDKYDVYFIADEIAVGFGRTGKMFACEHAEISPDLMTLSKGISGGYMPMSAVLLSNEIYNIFYNDYEEGKSFFHSHTYSGNPLGCAAACEVLNIFEEEHIIEKIKDLEMKLRKFVNKYLPKHDNIGEYRQLGFVGAIELVQDSKLKNGFPWKDRIGYKIYQESIKRGLILRPLDNVLYFMPPYCIKDDELEWMVKTAIEVIALVIDDEYYN